MNNHNQRPVALSSTILGAWRGGSILTYRSDFESMYITKSEYEEVESSQIFLLGVVGQQFNRSGY
jgi:actin-related protein 6